MVTVTSVRFRTISKSLYFDPGSLKLSIGDFVIVETERGAEIGLNISEPFQIAEEDLPAPLKPVVRIATDADLERADEFARRSQEAMPLYKKIVEQSGLDMRPVCVEYLFSGDKAVFYFVADDRVDFRELIRDLAAQFHIRIDMRRIGVRDEARMIGGYSQCGQELCCTRIGGEFNPVSIRMAKEQDFPLNPLKISGVCGRLMCCLRYEFEAYKDFKGRAPKKGALIETPLGLAKVCDLDIPRETVTMRFEDGKSFTVPLGKMDCPNASAEASRPCAVSQNVFDEFYNTTPTETFDISQAFTGDLLDGETSSITSVNNEPLLQRDSNKKIKHHKSVPQETDERKPRERSKKKENRSQKRQADNTPTKRKPGDGQRNRTRDTSFNDVEASVKPLTTVPSEGRKIRRRHTSDSSTKINED